MRDDTLKSRPCQASNAWHNRGLTVASEPNALQPGQPSFSEGCAHQQCRNFERRRRQRP